MVERVGVFLSHRHRPDEDAFIDRFTRVFLVVALVLGAHLACAWLAPGLVFHWTCPAATDTPDLQPTATVGLAPTPTSPSNRPTVSPTSTPAPVATTCYFN
jgi:hypothetical protein